MNKPINPVRMFNLLLLIMAILIIVPFEISSEIRSLPVNDDLPLHACIRMLNFFGDVNVSGQSATEAMYFANALYQTDYHGSLSRLAAYAWQKAPEIRNKVNSSGQLFYQAVLILLFFIFYQLARTNSEPDSRLALAALA